MSRKIKRGLVYMFSFLLLLSCGKTKEEQVEETVEAFSNTYFNWQFHRSIAYCTPDSKRWLNYMASQVKQDDVDLLRAQEESAEVKITHVNILDGDSVAKVEVTVRNYLRMDTIGTKGRIEEENRFIIFAKSVGNQWKVRLTSPLRAERD